MEAEEHITQFWSDDPAAIIAAEALSKIEEFEQREVMLWEIFNRFIGVSLAGSQSFNVDAYLKTFNLDAQEAGFVLFQYCHCQVKNLTYIYLNIQHRYSGSLVYLKPTLDEVCRRDFKICFDIFIETMNRLIEENDPGLGELFDSMVNFSFVAIQHFEDNVIDPPVTMSEEMLDLYHIWKFKYGC